MTFKEAIIVCFTKKFNDRKGRARRSEFWYFTLFNLLVGIALGIVLTVLDTPDNLANSISKLVNFIFLVPGVCVAVRRLHDTNRSGWWYLINITIIGIPYFIYLMAIDGNVGTNQYGPDPKGRDEDIEIEEENQTEETGGDRVF